MANRRAIDKSSGHKNHQAELNQFFSETESEEIPIKTRTEGIGQVVDDYAVHQVYVYLWHPKIQKWELREVLPNLDQAKRAGRALWRGGAAGIRIDEVRTVVEEKRT